MEPSNFLSESWNILNDQQYVWLRNTYKLIFQLKKFDKLQANN